MHDQSGDGRFGLFSFPKSNAPFCIRNRTEGPEGSFDTLDKKKAQDRWG
jgi:hypothetical protein